MKEIEISAELADEISKQQEKKILTTNEKLLIGRQELADLLGVSKKTLDAWDSKRRIPGRVKIGHLVKYQVCEIQKRIAGGKLLFPSK